MYPPRKDCEQILYLQVIVHYFVPVLSTYVCDHAASLRILAADYSTTLKCLASSKKSIEQFNSTEPRQPSALELLLVC